MAKLYEIVYKFDIKVILKVTLKKMLKSIILLILYTNSKFLYDCLIILNTI